MFKNGDFSLGCKRGQCHCCANSHCQRFFIYSHCFSLLNTLPFIYQVNINQDLSVRVAQFLMFCATKIQ
ncbi:hypothetical protein DVA44_18295 [Leclercia sp. W17]|nr:hypothetical protein DVA44_18295 [Leclercia sp. W17]